MKAVEMRNLQLVHTLCKEKADANLADNYGCTALMLAGALNRPEIVQYLLAVGANASAKVG